ncbi:MAG: GspE/PulE family protein [Oscillospiraceae bacterium]
MANFARSRRRVVVATATTYKRLGDLLVSVGLITPKDLTRALELQKSTKLRLGQVLIEYNFITQTQLVDALRMQLGVEFVDLSKTPIGPEMAQVLPKNIAKRHGVVPVRANRDEVWLAMSDPLNFVAIEEVKHVSRRRVIPMIAVSDAVDRAIITLYGNEGAARAIEDMKHASMGGESEAPQQTQVDDIQAAPTIRLVNSIIERAITERASDIHLEPREAELVVRMRIDGLLRNVLTVPRDLQSSVISRLKVMSAMDISERKTPQDGRANVRIKTSDVDLRVSTLPTVYGEKMVIRLLDKNAQILTRAGIGLEGVNLERFDQLMHVGSGVLLIAGPTGSGKSSTMSTMVRELNSEQVNLVTLEDPVEYNVDGVNQCQINDKTGMSFADGLRAILRQDPDIVSIGEIRDGETASIAMRAAITGHLVLSTIHTGDAVATLDRLADIGVETYLIASALKGVVAQRLVRKICPDCREEYEPDDGELAALQLQRTPGMKFYRGKGCPACFHTGYRGRKGVFEVLIIDHALHGLIARRASREELLACATQNGFVTLGDSCRALVLDGTISAAEGARTISSTME